MIKIGLTDNTPARKVIDIRDKSGQIKAKYSIGAKDVIKRLLMKDHYIEVSFNLSTYVLFVRSDYIEWEGRKYTLRADQPPVQVNKRKYQYTLKFEAIEMFFQDIQYYYLNQGLKEVEWRLVGNPEYFLKIGIDNINRYFETDEFRLGVIESTEIIDIAFSSEINVFDAFTAVAEKTDCEWHVEDRILHLRRKIYLGTEIDLETDVSVLSMKREDGKPTTKYTRIVALGSKRNIPYNYRGTSAGEAVDAIYQKRLRIPASKGDVIDAYPNMLPEEVVEGTVTFDAVYPKRIGVVEAVGTIECTDTDEETGEISKWLAYKFKDSGLSFKEEYVLPSQELRLFFQSGNLNGRDFALKFHDSGFSEADDSQYFEIKRTDDYGTLLPNDIMKPEVGDEYVLYGFDIALVSDQYVPEAEQELYDTATKWLQDQLKDTSTYECPTVVKYFADNRMELDIGQKVRLLLDDGDRLSSRIMGFEKKLNNPYDVTYTVGDNPAYSRLASIEKSIKELQLAGISHTSGGGNSIYIISQFDSTPPTDYNVYSAKRTLRQFLSKTQPDEAQAYINFVRGIGLASKLINDILRLGDEGEPGNQNVYSALRTDKEIANALNGLDDRYLRKDIEDTALKLIHFMEGIDVKDAATFRDSLNSPDFVSGFLDGKGWAILMKEFLNAAGVTENKSYAEFDEVTVRGALRVFELLINQLKGEADNYVFSGMMKVDSIDSEHRKIYFDTGSGMLYNPFREGDVLVCQRYGGMPTEESDYNILKQYELVVTEAGIGAEGIDRLDWIRFSEFVGDLSNVEKGDVVVRIDNMTDSDRKGVITTTSIGLGAPHIDVAYGLKTDPENALKVRIGRLDGIYNHWFGWLKGFGAFMQNLYAMGEFHLSNGENVRTRLDIMENLFRVGMQKTRQEISEEANFLRNATFTQNMDSWQIENDVRTLTVAGRIMMFNDNLYMNKESMSAIVNYEGRNLLRIRNAGICQINDNVRKPDSEDSKLYLTIKYLCSSPGKLTCGFQHEGKPAGGTMPYVSENISAGLEFVTNTYTGTWNGLGDFVMAFTGDMYVETLAVTSNPLDDYKVEVGTRFEQTDEKITLEGRRVDHLEGITSQLTVQVNAADQKIVLLGERADENEATLTQLGVNLNLVNERLTLYSNKTDDINSTVLNQGVRIDAAENQLELYADFKNSAEGTMTSLGQRLSAAEGTIDTYAERLNSLDGSMTSIGNRMNAAEGTIESYAEIANEITGDVTRLNSRMNAVEGRFSQYVLTETYNGFKADTEDSITRQWSAIEQTQQSISMSINRAVGYPIYKDLRFDQGLNGLQRYDSAAGLSSTISHVPVSSVTGLGSIPADQKNVVEISKTPSSGTTLMGGFMWTVTPRPNVVLQVRFIAKIPTGFTLNFSTPLAASLYKGRWSVSPRGTGNWKEYKYELVFADDASLQEAADTRLRIHLTRDTGSSSTAAVTWYLYYGTVFDLSGYEDPVSYVNLSAGLAKIKAERIEFEGAISANGNFLIDTEGNLTAHNATISGRIQSNDSGNRIVIDNATRRIMFIADTPAMGDIIEAEWNFSDNKYDRSYIVMGAQYPGTDISRLTILDRTGLRNPDFYIGDHGIWWEHEDHGTEKLGFQVSVGQNGWWIYNKVNIPLPRESDIYALKVNDWCVDENGFVKIRLS